MVRRKNAFNSRKGWNMITGTEGKFDFDTGSLCQSPCKTCEEFGNLPHCIAGCELLEAVQQRIACSFSCDQCVSEADFYGSVLNCRSTF